MSDKSARVRTRMVELPGGRVLHVSRFRDPDTGRDRVTLVRGWEQTSPLPPAVDGDVVEVPGSALPDLMAALRALAEEKA